MLEKCVARPLQSSAPSFFDRNATRIRLKEPIDNRSHDRFPAHAEKSVSPKLGRDPAESGAHRRIGLHHIAFLRGYFEGLDVGILADQYLALGRDKKRGLAAKRWIVEELVAAARKRGD